MIIKTKFSIGDKVYYVSSRSGGAEFEVVLGEISSINIGGKSYEKYQVGYNDYRSDAGVYTDLDTAKKEAKRKTKEHCELRLQSINKQELKPAYVQEVKE